MTDPTYTALLLIVDRSGSMQNIRSDMEGGLRALLTEQSALPGRLTVDLVVFDTLLERLAHFSPAAEVDVRIEPRGMTALLDALGTSIVKFGGELRRLPEQERPGLVQVVVVTDGLENSSKEWTRQAVATLVRQQRDVYRWDFVFLGADQDAVLVGGELGIAAASAMRYDKTADSVAAMNASVGRYITANRAAAAPVAAFTDEDRMGATTEQR